MEKLGLPDRAYRPSLPFGVDLFGLLPPPIFLDLVWQVVHHRHQEAKELNHVLRILLIRPRRSRLWVRTLVCEHANFVGPFLHDRGKMRLLAARSSISSLRFLPLAPCERATS